MGMGFMMFSNEWYWLKMLTGIVRKILKQFGDVRIK